MDSFETNLNLWHVHLQQIVGLTNNSGFANAHGIRHCVSQHPSLGHYVLEVAKVLLLQLYLLLDVMYVEDYLLYLMLNFCRGDWIICCLLALPRNTENPQ